MKDSISPMTIPMRIAVACVSIVLRVGEGNADMVHFSCVCNSEKIKPDADRLLCQSLNLSHGCQEYSNKAVTYSICSRRRNKTSL